MSCHVEGSVFCFCSVDPSNTRTPPVSARLEAAPPPAPPPIEPSVAKLETFEWDQLAPDLAPSRSKKACASSNAAALWSPLRDATRCVAPRQEGGEVRSAASAGDERPENRAQSSEKVESAPGNIAPPRKALLPVAPVRRCGMHTSHPSDWPLSARPQNRAQGLEKVDSAPGFATDVGAAACPSPLRDATRCVAPRREGGEVRSAASAGDERPENRAQGLEKVESAPGIAVAACPSPLRHATRCVAPRQEGGEVRSAASAGDERPENRAEVLEKVESAPGIAVAASPSPLRHATRCVGPRHEGGEIPSADSAGDERPENLAEVLEKVESAPGDFLVPRSPGQEPGGGRRLAPGLDPGANLLPASVEKERGGARDCDSRSRRRAVRRAARRDASGRDGSPFRFPDWRHAGNAWPNDSRSLPRGGQKKS